MKTITQIRQEIQQCGYESVEDVLREYIQEILNEAANRAEIEWDDYEENPSPAMIVNKESITGLIKEL